jgi:hypothetical protein
MNIFESREGKVGFSDEVIYRFVSDVRNFERFIPPDSVKDWKTTIDSCSFEIPYAGKTIIRITQKIPHSEVVYSGKGFQNTEFSIKILIIKVSESTASVKAIVRAELNPMLKMIAAKPLEKFLERLITEIENFDGWENIIK